jgi:hypothetical protein
MCNIVPLFAELTLQQVIDNCPYRVTEGHMTPSQQIQYNERLKSYENIYSILEIGLNAGHSAENFFQQCPHLKTFVSIDICSHPYTPYAIHYFQENYKNRFIPVIGDSLIKIPEYAELHPDQKFDLIFIDGNHSYHYCLNDIINCRKVAHTKTHLWVDDYQYESVSNAIGHAVESGLMVIDHIHEDPVSQRIWVEAHYTLREK